MKVKTQDLQRGDVLSSGETVTRTPYPETNPIYGRNKMVVSLQKANGQKEARIWGKYTTIFVTKRATI